MLLSFMDHLLSLPVYRYISLTLFHADFHVQTYAVAALIQLTETVSYKGAASLGALVFAAQTLPSLVTSLFYEKRPSAYVGVRAASGLLQTVGLAVISPLNVARTMY